MKLSNKGFTIIEGLLIIVLLAVIGFTGYRVYTANQNTNDTLNKSDDVADQVIITNEEQIISTPTVDNSTEYLTIAEWGVKVPQIPEGNIISYQYNADRKSARFVSSEQKALGGFCGEFDLSRVSILGIEGEYGPDDKALANPYAISDAIENGNAIKIDDYTYYILGDMSGGDCTGTLKEGQSISESEITANKNLFNALKGIIKAE